uniref:Uncharacterized protein n=1 Tax=Meloidogyne enterolobii TaxID=390850 RepID=A0A6V7XCS6_MELEN|nr:unnamed protein product [Meloidogyne enterolobii]CAD2196995.1 unnamed protein product [Meloidogyne enterolobii]
MCELRGFSILRPSVDLETIEEEPDDYVSQHSRNARSLKNGLEGGHFRDNIRQNVYQQENGGQNSQTNTITTYATQNSDGFDTNSLNYLNWNRGGGRAGSTKSIKSGIRNTRYRGLGYGNGTIGTHITGGTSTAGTLNGTRYFGDSWKSLDKWDQNYYFNTYGPPREDPISLYQWSNSKNYGDAIRRHVSQLEKDEKRKRRQKICCLLCCCFRCCFSCKKSPQPQNPRPTLKGCRQLNWN